MTEIIAVVSHKGGVGKTTLVQNLGHELARRGRVLLVDLDPQANLTIGCGLDPGVERPTIYHAMSDPAQTAAAVVPLTTGALLPANLDLALAEQRFAGFYDRNDKLKDALATVQGQFAYVLIDSPPNLGFFAFNALTAATHALIPLQCQPYAYRALDNTLQLIRLVQKGNPALQLKRIVLTMVDRRLTLTRSVENAVRERFGALVAQSVIPLNVTVAEATLDGVAVAHYAPGSAGALAYQALAEELYNG